MPNDLIRDVMYEEMKRLAEDGARWGKCQTSKLMSSSVHWIGVGSESRFVEYLSRDNGSIF